MTEVTVKIEQGLLRGKVSVNYKNGLFYSFYGIPYAVPPVGELRFKAPQTPKAWKGVQDATQEKDGCITRNMYTGKVEGGEDCLFLNVYCPELPSNRHENLKPVMVWIHGGAFHTGSTKTELFGPDYLLTQDVVLVTVSYRLGALGFLCLEDTALGVTGNNAFRDIIMALEWVQKNIKVFLGNPDNVTLFGESSGGVSAHYLMLSPLAKGLFHKIILQSGCCLHHWSEGRRDSAQKMMETMGLSLHSDKEILEFLLKQPAEAIYAAQENIRVSVSPHLKRHFYPVIEKISGIEPPVITENPADLIKKGNYIKVPMIIGYTSEEGMFFDFLIKKNTKTNKNNPLITDLEVLVPHHLNFPRQSAISKYIANEIKSFYFNDEEPTLKYRKQFYEVQADASFNFILFKTAAMHMKNLGHPIYFFRFSVDGKHNFYKQLRDIEWPGASHSDDVCYLFRMLPAKEIVEDSLEDTTIQRMTKLWTNFARYSDPNPKERDEMIPITWKPVEEGNLHFMDIGNNLSVGVNPEYDRFQFWNKIYSLHPILGKL